MRGFCSLLCTLVWLHGFGVPSRARAWPLFDSGSNASRSLTAAREKFPIPGWSEAEMKKFNPRNPYEGVRKDQKIAFMFLTRGLMPLEGVWAKFFLEKHSSLFNVYLHPSPEHKGAPCDGHGSSGAKKSPFAGRCIPPAFRVHTAWGSPSLAAAARNMLAYAALDDPSNAYFALLSDSCIPLWPITHVHGFLTAAKSSYLVHMPVNTAQFPTQEDLPKRVYHSDEYIVGSQWWILNRKHAVALSVEAKSWPKYRKYCEITGAGYPCGFYKSEFEHAKYLLYKEMIAITKHYNAARDGGHISCSGARSQTTISPAELAKQVTELGRAHERAEFLDCSMFAKYRSPTSGLVRQAAHTLGTGTEDFVDVEATRECPGLVAVLQKHEQVLDVVGAGRRNFQHVIGYRRRRRQRRRRLQSLQGDFNSSATWPRTRLDELMLGGQEYRQGDREKGPRRSALGDDSLDEERERQQNNHHHGSQAHHTGLETILDFRSGPCIAMMQTAFQVGRFEQMLVNKGCTDKKQTRFHKSEELNPRCVPDMRYFASALSRLVGDQQALSKMVPNIKLTATSWASSAFPSSNPAARIMQGCRMKYSHGPHPLEWVSGDCLDRQVIEIIRSESFNGGKTALFARKFASGTAQFLQNVNYLAC